MTAILSSVLDFFTELGAVHYKKMQHTGYLRHLLLRRGVTSGEILVHVITTSQAEYDYAPLVLRRPSAGGKNQELCTLSMILCLMWCRAMKPDCFMDRITSVKRLVFDRRLVIFSFFQPNSLAADVYFHLLCVIDISDT